MRKRSGEFIVLDDLGGTFSLQEVLVNDSAQFIVLLNDLQTGIYHLVFEDHLGQKNHQKFILTK